MVRVEGDGAKRAESREKDEASVIRPRERGDRERERERGNANRPFLAGANAKKKQHRTGWEGWRRLTSATERRTSSNAKGGQTEGEGESGTVG